MASSKSPLNTKGYLLLIFTVFGWGISWPFLKIALTEIPPWTFRGLIAPAAAVLIFGIGALLKKTLELPLDSGGKLSWPLVSTLRCGMYLAPSA